MNVCELTLVVLTSPSCQEQVPHDETHEGCCDEFVSGLGRRLPVNFGCCTTRATVIFGGHGRATENKLLFSAV
jgi:hypothetical protein